jgi:hypothetical protein
VFAVLNHQPSRKHCVAKYLSENILNRMNRL